MSVGITVLISGAGTNLQALIDACHAGTIPETRILRVISDRKDAYGLQRAEEAGIPIARHGILPYKKRYPDNSSPRPQFEEARRVYDADLAQLVLKDQPQLVVCAGFMRIVTPAFLEPLKSAGVVVINLHPALHGDLAGANCIERAWNEYKAGQRTKTGIMIHYVIAEVDRGEPIVQKEIGIEGCEALEQLEERIRAAEHVLIVEGTRIVSEKVSTRANGQNS